MPTYLSYDHKFTSLALDDRSLNIYLTGGLDLKDRKISTNQTFILDTKNLIFN